MALDGLNEIADGFAYFIILSASLISAGVLKFEGVGNVILFAPAVPDMDFGRVSRSDIFPVVSVEDLSVK